MKRRVRWIAVFFVLLCLIGSTGLSVYAEEQSYKTTYEDMLDRAEAIVNFKWTPSKKIAVWNENPYQGSNYFEEGQEVIGMPYTLFTSEVVSDSMLSLSQFKEKVDINESQTAYCYAVGANRTGPIYGSCCATFVSEIFGGSFMQGDDPIYDSVLGINNSSYVEKIEGAKVTDLKRADAVSTSNNSHIIWIGEITDTTITIYEQTPPVARRVTKNLSDCVNKDGYLTLVYDGEASVFSVAARSKELIDEDYKSDSNYPVPIQANTISKDKTSVYGRVDGEVKLNKIYGKGVEPDYQDDICTIEKIYTNGWCLVSFPLTSGKTDWGYVNLSVFFADSDYAIKKHTLNGSHKVYARSDLEDELDTVAEKTEIYVVGEENNNWQILYPNGGDEWILGWIQKEMEEEITENDQENPPKSNVTGDINGDGKLDGKDVVRICKYLHDYDEATCQSSCTVNKESDVNGDGKIDRTELEFLLDTLSKIK